jgi:hypothetical protein
MATKPLLLCATLDPRIWEFLRRAEEGVITHEELADLFIAHLSQATIGQRDEVLPRIRGKFATQAELNAFLASASGRIILKSLFSAAIDLNNAPTGPMN